ncbi:hypothetical protein [Streptomyces sp. NPDC086023]|uniref:hypothetical protein n=1 Tax=Streptomyces sp. NPDC086023 TaxID=3365746 RepID=UPI0037D0F6B6
MHTENAGDAANPLIEHLRQVEAIEHNRWTAAEAACSKAADRVNELRQRLLEAEKEVDAAEQGLTVATERLAAVRETIASAERFLARPAEGEAGPQDGESGRQRQGATTGARPGGSEKDEPGAPTLKALILRALSGGQATSLGEIFDHVRRSRPDTKQNSIRSTLANMLPEDRVVSVARGIYQLVPEAHT